MNFWNMALRSLLAWCLFARCLPHKGLFAGVLAFEILFTAFTSSTTGCVSYFVPALFSYFHLQYKFWNGIKSMNSYESAWNLSFFQSSLLYLSIFFWKRSLERRGGLIFKDYCLYCLIKQNIFLSSLIKTPHKIIWPVKIMFLKCILLSAIIKYIII